MSETKINQSVVIWARGKKGRQVGRGECWDLADRALHHAGARSSTTTGDDDDYVWGDEVALKDVEPGDVLQFRDFVTTQRTDVAVEFNGGGGYAEWKEDPPQIRPHHTAIVDHVAGDGDIIIIEQHVRPLGKTVQIHSIPIRGRVLPTKVTQDRIYDKASGRYRLAKITKTVTVGVTGKIWAYRPKPK
jgi:hypothetical protein